jgi:hypothetical protein
MNASQTDGSETFYFELTDLSTSGDFPGIVIEMSALL